VWPTPGLGRHAGTTLPPMSRHGRLNRSIRWAALLALLLATLAPSVAHAMRHLRGETMPWSQLCSATGGKRVVFGWRADGGGSSPRADASGPCTACLLHHGGWASPPTAPAIALRTDLQVSVAAPRPLQTRLSFVWHPAQPRAPPTLA